MVVTLGPVKERVPFGQAAGLAEIDRSPLVQARHHINTSLAQSGQRGILSKGAVSQKNVAYFQSLPELLEQTQIVVMEAAPDGLEQSSAIERKEHHQFHDGKAAARFLRLVLGKALLVGGGVGQLNRRAVDDLDGPALQLRGSSDPPFGHFGGRRERMRQAWFWQALAGLNVGGISLGCGTAAAQAPQGLHVAHHFTAGGARLEHLPDEALKGQPQAEDPVATVWPFVLAGKQRRRQQAAQMTLELFECALAQSERVAGPQRGQPGAPGRKIGGVHGLFTVSIYTHHIDSQSPFCSAASMPKAVAMPAQYQRLRRQLARVGYLTQGSVFERKPGQQGSRYVWTRKVKAKTVTVALSKEQYRELKKAAQNQRRLQATVAAMQRLSRRLLFQKFASVTRRKHLSKRVLGLN